MNFDKRQVDEFLCEKFTRELSKSPLKASFFCRRDSEIARRNVNKPKSINSAAHASISDSSAAHRAAFLSHVVSADARVGEKNLKLRAKPQNRFQSGLVR